MKLCRHMKMLLGVSALAAVFSVGLVVDHGTTAVASTRPTLAPGEHARTIEAMRPPKRTRPVVAVLGHNAGTETTDFLVPYGVLAEADVADVIAVAPDDAPMRLKPALAVRPQSTLAAFDARHADGADYVIVAAMHPRDDARVLDWLRAQSRRGAIIVGICSGVRTLAAAGLLEGRRATSYWYDARDVAELSPSTRWVRDRRYVVDGNIVTTTGISASMPIALALVEAIAGQDRANAVARTLGVGDWSEGHDGLAFGFDLRTRGVAIDNALALWKHETIGIPLSSGTDEVALAFAADAWSRTFSTEVRAFTKDGRPVSSRRGLTLLPDAGASAARSDRILALPRLAPGRMLDDALAGIGRRHGRVTEAFVATQLEYPR